MKVDLFDFDLPRALIAQRPAEPRETARLLRIGRDRLTDHRISDLPDLLRPDDLLVVNDTRVIPSRLFGHRGEARVEVTLHKAEGLDVWAAFARPARKLRLGDRFEAGADDARLTAEVVERRDAGEVVLRFDRGGGDLIAALEAIGRLPLPPYIDRPDGADDRDSSDYQTLFAREKGAVAAPTAGLHFTDGLLAALDARGIERLALTLHVGAGTFLPVKADDTVDHKMHAEWGRLAPDAAARLNAARDAGRRIVAIGTTAMRLLETAAGPDRRFQAFEGDTAIFLTPGGPRPIRGTDALMTNFHLPRSTLFMLVSAFAGLNRMRAAYSHAIDQGYRFFSYGDACLIDHCPDDIPS
ncbi:tRNA preQ1(34) S-adenosylmethionine ribosyltransferase-isomerase QueA [Tistrella sp. BH-R2-4]|uniref:S-adenosylmethionine:tRNA ribosyltransferase-isomerase n=1 Tax=Tistrella arctica TaxID=3133430 RepID=A0ABU9YF99_9PROT